MQNLRIDPQRLWDQLMETAQFGATAKGGIKRLTLTDDDKRVRDWFKAQCEALGCTVTVDEVGNMFARRPGRNDALPPIAMGSHLDTQPTGGKFDGVLGVLGALEALRTLVEVGYETNAPIELVNWTNEEGSRFAPAMLARACSPACSRPTTPRRARTVMASDSATSWSGSAIAAPSRPGGHRLGALFELHIEQGPILEAEGKLIGVVQGVQGMRWYEVTVTGQDAHTGATPMHLRKNALLGAARMIERIHQIALAHAPAAVGTVGLVEVRPNSRNVVPGEVFFAVDFRHPEEAVLDAMEARVPRGAARGHGAAGPGVRGEADLALARRRVRSRADRLRPQGCGAGGSADARHGLWRRPRRRLHRARGADDDDLRPLPRRHQPQREREHDLRGMRRRGAGAAQRGAGVRPAVRGLTLSPAARSAPSPPQGCGPCDR